MPCEECQASRKAIATSLMEFVQIFWHYGQIIPDEDRHQLAKLVPQLLTDDEIEKARVRNAIVDLLAGHEVRMIFRSKHKEIAYQPIDGNS